jgi:hypothetical protein
MRLGMSLAVVISVLGAGCPAGDDGESGASATDASSGGTAMTDPATTDPATTDPATTDPATTDPATTDPATTDPSDTTEDPGTETDPSDTTGSQGDPCEITDEDSECDACVKGMCCDQLTACDMDPECVCFQECAGSMEPSINVPTVCGDMCGVDQPFAHPTIGQVLSCSNGCLVQCL